MSKAGLSLFVFGFYLIIVGLGFMIAPHWNLRLFGLSAGDDVWIRLVGMLASIIGAYYLLAVRARLEVFFQWTVPGRYYAAGFMALHAQVRHEVAFVIVSVNDQLTRKPVVPSTVAYRHTSSW